MKYINSKPRRMQTSNGVKKSYFILPLTMAALIFVVSPLSVFAHSSHVFKIGDKHYEIVIGSLGEPVVVDDKTGVDLRVSGVFYRDGMSKDQYRGTAEPVTGLGESLQVELIAGDKKKILPLKPQFRKEGAYDAAYFPTIATALQYRIFGDIEGVPFDYTFSCNPSHGGHGSDENTEHFVVSDQVTQVFQSGSYGCPAPKADMGFPEQSAALNELRAVADEADGKAGTAQTLALVAGLLGIIGIGAAVWRRRK